MDRLVALTLTVGSAATVTMEVALAMAQLDPALTIIRYVYVPAAKGGVSKVFWLAPYIGPCTGDELLPLIVEPSPSWSNGCKYCSSPCTNGASLTVTTGAELV
jgi:hypothetical protein